jgi:hypothetical protein
MTWLQFKSLVLGDRKTMRSVCEALGLKPFDLREFCKKQLHDKNGMELYFAHKHSATGKEDDEEGASTSGADED